MKTLQAFATHSNPKAHQAFDANNVAITKVCNTEIDLVFELRKLGIKLKDYTYKIAPAEGNFEANTVWMRKPTTSRETTMTKEDAINATYRQEFHHIKLTNADGSPLRARVNGACKVWKTRPADFRLPMKYGLRECFYIDQDNAHEWVVPS